MFWGKPMSRTIVGKFVAFALAIAPVFYCAPSWAESPLAPAAKDAVDAAPKVVEEMKAWWKDHREKVKEKAEEKAVEVPVDLGTDCVKKALKEGTCKDTSQ
jgi:hypothetical protein